MQKKDRLIYTRQLDLLPTYVYRRSNKLEENWKNIEENNGKGLAYYCFLSTKW